MATSKGRAEVSRYMRQIPVVLETKVLRGAARAGGQVIADEAKLRANSEPVREGVIIRTKSEDGRVVVRISVREGWARSLGIWAEYGTDPHFISVDASQSEGKSVRRINEQAKEGSLIIGGKFVGTTVLHPGARPHPFLRPALDNKQAEAIAAAQGYITTRLAREGLGGAEVPEDRE